MKTELDRKTTTCLRLMEKTVALAKTTTASNIRDDIRQISELVYDLKKHWRLLASMEYACERVFNEYSDGYLRMYNLDAFTRSVFNETITLPEDMMGKLCDYREEFLKNTDLKKVFDKGGSL